MGKLILQNDPNAALAEASQFEYNLFKGGYDNLCQSIYFSLYVKTLARSSKLSHQQMICIILLNKRNHTLNLFCMQCFGPAKNETCQGFNSEAVKNSNNVNVAYFDFSQ